MMCLTLSKYIFLGQKSYGKTTRLNFFLSQKSCISSQFTPRPNKSSEARHFTPLPNKSSESPLFLTTIFFSLNFFKVLFFPPPYFFSTFFAFFFYPSFVFF